MHYVRTERAACARGNGRQDVHEARRELDHVAVDDGLEILRVSDRDVHNLNWIGDRAAHTVYVHPPTGIDALEHAQVCRADFSEAHNQRIHAAPSNTGTATHRQLMICSGGPLESSG